MAILPIKTFGESCLKKKCVQVKELTPDIIKLINNMVETMYAAKGVGLAAPQVGVNKQIVVVDVGDASGKHELVVLINPLLLQAEGTEAMEEGCLSCPGISVKVARAQKIIVQAMSRNGEKIIREDTGFLARAIQHEMDHLEGQLIVDKVGFWQKMRLKKKLKKRS